MATNSEYDRFLDAGEEPLTLSNSIKGSENQPLVSFADSIQHLKSSIGNSKKIATLVKQKSLDRSYDLTPDEAAAISLFTARSTKSRESVSDQLNQALRSQNQDVINPWLPYIKLLLSGLLKVPLIQGTVFRATQGHVSNLYKGKCKWWGFSSCIGNNKWYERLIKEPTPYTIFAIECTSGRNISDCSAFVENGEVVLMPGTSLVFVSSTKRRQCQIIRLKEEDCENEFLATLMGRPSLVTPSLLNNGASDRNSIQQTTGTLLAQTEMRKNLNCRFHDDDRTRIMTPEDLIRLIEDPPVNDDDPVLERVKGSMIGMALGDALGAHVEFRPRSYFLANQVKDLRGGGTWGLTEGQFTDDTSMALCLACSLIVNRDFIAYDQLVRYKWWYKYGYMSSTGTCFDIGAATRQSLEEFMRRQQRFAIQHEIRLENLDNISDPHLLDQFKVNCSAKEVAGNGALMRLAPVPLFFYKYPRDAVKLSGMSGEITHGDVKSCDACRYYGALIVAALRGETREDLLSNHFYTKHADWFDNEPLTKEIMRIAKGSYKKDGYDAGIRGKGYVVDALEAALWALWSDNGSFEEGVLKAVNLGDDTDTTAAIYGQLAGALYGFRGLPEKWVKQIYASKFIDCLSRWLTYEGQLWHPTSASPSTGSNANSGPPKDVKQISAPTAESPIGAALPAPELPPIPQNRRKTAKGGNDRESKRDGERTPRKQLKPQRSMSEGTAKDRNSQSQPKTSTKPEGASGRKK